MRAPTACTIIARNYLSHARILAASYLAHHPESRFYLLVVDDLPAGVDAGPGIRNVPCASLEIPHFFDMSVKYDVTELCTAVKPSFLRTLFKRYGERRVVYLDPDILVMRRMTELVQQLAVSDIVLTPHLDKPIPFDGYKPSEVDILVAGAYNLGFIAVRQTSQTRALLSWWEERLRDHCRVDPGNGLMTDQRWVDLVPSLFPTTTLLRDTTYNVAYWNLHSRAVERAGDTYTVNGRPLAFFHFSGFSPAQPGVLSKHQTRTDLSAGTPLATLFDEYRGMHLAEGYDESRQWTYGMSTFDNGISLGRHMRKLYLELDEATRLGFGNPRSTTGHGSFLEWAVTPQTATRDLSPFLERIYRYRNDVATAFPDVRGADRERFLRWARTQGAREMGFDPRIVLPSLGRPLLSTALDAVEEERRLNTAGPAPTVAAATVDGVTLATRPAVGRSLSGVNVCGYLRDESGVGEVARGYIDILEHIEMPRALLDVSELSVNRSKDSVLSSFDAKHPHPVNLVCINADQHFTVMRKNEGFFAARYNIACWQWEVPAFPDEWHDRFAHYNEIWVLSSFVATAISEVAPIPVVRVPTVVRPPSGNRRHGRAMLGIKNDEFVVLFMFDAHSYFERKNPMAVVEAFRLAFGNDTEARLVIKCVNGRSDATRLAALREAVERVGGTLITDYLDRRQNGALVHACDAYISLHRAEGFGLTVAEAMAIGKPVITTDWSGTADFTDVGNSFLVRHEMTTLRASAGPYPAGTSWAEPSVAHAASLLRQVADDPVEARRRGRAARHTMESRYTPDAVAPIVKRRLALIAELVEHTPPRPSVAPAPNRSDNRDILDPIRRIVSEHVPAQSIVVVVSKGDPDLVDLPDRIGWHFPQTDEGVYAGYHPETAEEAIAHLELLRARGGRYFLVPATSSWWLSYYGGLRTHLDSIGELLIDDPACMLFRMIPHEAPKSNGDLVHEILATQAVATITVGVPRATRRMRRSRRTL